MNLSTSVLVLVLATSLAGWWACACRLNVMSKHTVSKRTRLQFAGLMGGFTAGGMSPWLPPGVGVLLLMLLVFAFLVLGAGRWRHGPPQELRTDHGALDPLDDDHERTST